MCVKEYCKFWTATKFACGLLIRSDEVILSETPKRSFNMQNDRNLSDIFQKYCIYEIESFLVYTATKIKVYIPVLCTKVSTFAGKLPWWKNI